MLQKHRGELYLVLGAVFFSINGVIVTLVLDHMTTFRLAQVRAIGTFFLLFIITFIMFTYCLLWITITIPSSCSITC
jgi:hypothetical protein